MAVVATLFERERGVGLHAHVEDVGWVACDATNETGSTSDADEGEKTGRRVSRGQSGLELLVDSESRRRVGQLAQDCGRQLYRVWWLAKTFFLPSR